MSLTIVEKKENFFSIAVTEGERYNISDSQGKIILSFIASEDAVYMTYRKKEVSPMRYV